MTKRIRSTALVGIVGVLLLSISIPLVQHAVTNRHYKLNASTTKLIGKANKNLATKISFDASKDTYTFNKAGLDSTASTAKDKNDPTAILKQLQSQVGGGGSKDKSLYSVSMPTDSSKGITYTDNNVGLNFSLIPQFKQSAGREVGGRLVYPTKLGDESGVSAIYTNKSNGLKEDLVLTEPSKADKLSFSYQLKLPKALEARLTKDGGLGIYSADPSLYGTITYGSDTDQETVMKAREIGAKNNLVFALPAPTIVQTNKANDGTAQADFFLDNDILTVKVANLQSVPAKNYPISIDPSVVVTSSSDFAGGNDEDSSIDYSTVDQISRGGYSGGSVSAGWTTNVSAFTTARYNHTSVAYNGYLYILGGNNGTTTASDVQYAPINANGSIGTWAATTSFATIRESHTSFTYNGYLYVMGGNSGATYYNDVQYAPINANGTLGAWVTTSSFSNARSGHTTVTYNSYVYVVGGYTGTARLNDVQYAPINADGSIGIWTAATSFATIRSNHSSVVYNGNLYVLGGWNGTTYYNDVQYAPINANGSLGTWVATTSFTTIRAYHASITSNGYLYVLGGNNGATYYGDVQYAPINGNGTVGTWATSTAISVARTGHSLITNKGYLYVTGGTNGTARNDIIYAKIDTAGVTRNYTATTSLLAETTGPNTFTNRTRHASVAYGGRIYVLGGTTATPISRFYSSVIFATINTDGSLGTWTNTTAFTTGREGLAAVAYDGYMYVLGGKNSAATNLNDVQYASIGTTGVLGTWASTTAFTGVRSNHSAVAYKGYMYVLGGQGAAANNDVQYAAISATGTVGTWNTTTSFTTARYGHGAVVYKGYIYVGGGYDGITYYNDIQYAPISGTGTVGAWTTTTAFTTPRTDFTLGTYNGILYLTGGSNGTDKNDVQYASFNSNGTISAWATTTVLPAARDNHAVAIANGFIYTIGGEIVAGTTYDDVQYAPINNGSFGTAAAWANTSTFTTSRYGHTNVAYNGFMYVLGGLTGASTYLNDVQYAPINPNGTLGTYVATTSYTTGRNYHTSFAANGYLYVTGGWNGTTYYNDVQYALICTGSNSGVGGCSATPGSIGTWASTSAFTTARRGHTSIVYNGYAYIIGGYTGALVNDVQYALLCTGANSGVGGCSATAGTVGTWIATSSFATARNSHTSVVNNGYVYVIGGYTPAYTRDVQYALICTGINNGIGGCSATAGSLGTWITTTRLLAPLANQASGVYKGYLYNTGGTPDGSAVITNVSYAPFNSDGTIGEWSGTSPLVTARYLHAATTYNGFIYVTGGNGGTNTTEYAQLKIMPRVSRFSKLVDLGSSASMTGVTYNGILTNGTAAITYKTWAADGTTLVADSQVPTGASCSLAARFVLVSVDMEDAGEWAYYPDNLGNGTITDISINYTAQAHPQTKVRLQHGKFFDNEQLRALDTCGA